MSLRDISWSNIGRVLFILCALVASVATTKSGPRPRHPVRAQSRCGDVTISITETGRGVLALRATFDARACPTIDPHARLVNQSTTVQPTEIKQPEAGTVTVAFKDSSKHADVDIQFVPEAAFRVVIQDGRIDSLMDIPAFAK
jgi:hypothetical protein